MQGRSSPRRGAERWSAVAASAVFLLALVHLFGGIWSQGLDRVAPATTQPGAWQFSTENDLRFGAWGTSRNAYVLVRSPWRLFDAEPCFPAQRSLALGHPMISLGVLGSPVRLFVADPIVTYNLVVALVLLASALAMFALVRDWTGEPAAGIAAGVLYAFHPVALDHVHHLFIFDTSWTVWALFFARRLCAGGRWRDALALGAALSMQLAGSFYCAAAAFVLGVPFAVWCLWPRRGRRVALAPVAAALAIVLVGAALVYGPFLAMRDEVDFARRAQFFAAWRDFLPAGNRFPGWWLLALVAAALLGGRPAARGADAGDPRWALLAGVLLLTLAATGGGVPSVADPSPLLRLPNLYAALDALLPGFEAIRVPGLLAGGVHLGLCALAGCGAAAALRWVPEPRRLPAAAGLVALTLGVTLGAQREAGERGALYAAAIRPGEDSLALYAWLERAGSSGPVLEVPTSVEGTTAQADGVLLSSFHHRRTSSCYNSILPRSFEEVARLSQDLPAPAAIEAARARGFTTLVVRHPPGGAQARAARERFEQAARRPQAGLRLLHTTPSVSAFALAPAGPDAAGAEP